LMDHKLFDGDGSALQASLVRPALEGNSFESATGWHFRFEEYTYTAGRHCVSDSDATKLRRLISSSSRDDPQLWVRFVEGGKLRARRLLEVAESLETRELLDGLHSLRAAITELVPFIAARPLVQAELESSLLKEVAEAMGGKEPAERAAVALDHLFVTRQESEARREVRRFYRLAGHMCRNRNVLELVVDKSSPRALKTLAGDYPELHDPLVRHVDEYGWLRTRHHSFAPMSAKDIVQRLQKVFLRWEPEQIAQAASPQPRREAGETLGFEPNRQVAESIAVLEDVLTLRDLRIDAVLHAKHRAHRFFDKVAMNVKCTSSELALFTAEEIASALEGTAPLPKDELEERAKAQPDSPKLEGQSVALGRAVGPVRILTQGSEGGRLALGDVLVTGLSSPDHSGNQSMFPTRTDASAPVEDAAAIVIDDGGLLSHAAMISRELGIPCVVGTERATHALIEGRVVEVDATRSEGRIVPFDYD
jgi:phosphohistidine swiveling domain-containing protein